MKEQYISCPKDGQTWQYTLGQCQLSSYNSVTVFAFISEQHLQIIENWTKQDENFIETEAFRHIYNECLQLSCITITGSSGSGKSAIAYHIALKLSIEGYIILPVTSIDEVQKFWDINKKQLFVYDDPVGTETVDLLKLSDLQARTSYLDTLFNESPSKLVFTCRSIVITDEALNASNTILKRNINDLHSKALALSKNEKIQILEHYTRRIKGKSVDMDRISDLEFSNFPFLCSMYAKNEKYQSKGGIFFDNMFPILQEELDQLRKKSPLEYLVLVVWVVLANEKREIVIINWRTTLRLANGLAKALGIQCNFSIRDLNEAGKGLLNVYLIAEGETIKFLHDTLFEAVVYHFGMSYPREILKRCTTAFIREHIRVGKNGMNTNAISLKPKDYCALAASYITAIRNGYFYDTFLSEPLNDPNILECIKEEVDKMTQDEFSQLFLKTSNRQMKTVTAKK